MQDDLVCAIREVVRDFVNETTLEQLESGSGGPVSKGEREVHEWYASLPEAGRNHLRKIVSNAVDETIYGVLGVVDDMQSFEQQRGRRTPARTSRQEVCFVVDNNVVA